MNIKGSTCVVTGAARGLGAALSRELVARGAQVVISDLESANLQDIGIELDMPTFACNVGDREQVVALARAAIDEYGKIDLWINNAGVWMPNAAAEEIDFNKTRELMEVNYFGTAYGTVEAIRHMRGKNEGTILNVLSVRSLIARAQSAAYAASKHAAHGFTASVREELKDTGIKVLGVYPYRMKTGFFTGVTYKDYDSYMEPAEVAKIILDNVSKENPSEHQEIWSLDDVRVR